MSDSVGILRTSKKNSAVACRSFSARRLPLLSLMWQNEWHRLNCQSDKASAELLGWSPEPIKREATLWLWSLFLCVFFQSWSTKQSRLCAQLLICCLFCHKTDLLIPSQHLWCVLFNIGRFDYPPPPTQLAALQHPCPSSLQVLMESASNKLKIHLRAPKTRFQCHTCSKYTHTYAHKHLSISLMAHSLAGITALAHKNHTWTCVEDSAFSIFALPPPCWRTCSKKPWKDTSPAGIGRKGSREMGIEVVGVQTWAAFLCADAQTWWKQTFLIIHFWDSSKGLNVFLV